MHSSAGGSKAHAAASRPGAKAIGADKNSPDMV